MRDVAILAVALLAPMVGCAEDGKPRQANVSFAAHDSWPVLVQLSVDGEALPEAVAVTTGADADVPKGTTTFAMPLRNDDMIAWDLRWTELRTGDSFAQSFSQTAVDIPHGDTFELIFTIGRGGEFVQTTLSQARHDENEQGLLQQVAPQRRADYPELLRMCAHRVAQDAPPDFADLPGPVRADYTRIMNGMRAAPPETSCLE